MSVALRKPNRVTEQEYLEFENSSQLRHEFVGGVIYAMVGGSDRRNLITGNVFAALHRGVPETCHVFSVQMKLRVALADDVDYFYPDIFVACEPTDRAPLYREQPCLIIEVISPSTEREDRRDKFLAYTQIDTLQEYILVAQDVPQIEIMRRRAAWKPEFRFLADQLELESVNLGILVSDIYRQIAF